MTYTLDVTVWRDFLRSLDALVLHAFLKELAAELNRRDYYGWRAVSDVADTVLNDVQVAARRAADTLLARATTARAAPPGASER